VFTKQVLKDAEDTPCQTDTEDKWFSVVRKVRAVAALRCVGECPFAAECREIAAANDEKYGVWGGVDFQGNKPG
jgi:hypothetical protein